MPLANAFFGATFSVSVAYLLRQTYAVDTWIYSLYCSVTAATSMIVPLFAVPLVKKYPANRLFFAATLVIAAGILLIGVCAVCGIYQILPVAVSVVLITALDCVTIAAAMNNARCEYTGYCDPSCIVDNMGRIIAAGPRDDVAVVTADVDIAREPDPQYGSQAFYRSHSMRKTRFSQRRPDTYKLINAPLEETPLYKRYFGKEE